MEPEESDRHSRKTSEPVTIDLEKAEVQEVAASEAEGTEEDVTASTAAETDGAKSYTGIPKAGATTSTTGNIQAEPVKTEARKPAGGPSLVAASLIGGVIALAGAAGLQFWGVLPSMSSNDELKASVELVSGDLEKLREQVQTVATTKPEVDLTPVTEKLAALEERVAKVPEANGLSADADARIAALMAQVKTAEEALGAEKTAAETARAALEMRIESMEKQLSQPRDDVQVAVAIATAGLKAAIDRGGPFVTELDTLSGIDAANAAVTELKAFAAEGVPTRLTLVADFPAVADKILVATEVVDPNQSFTDRLMASAFSAIKVRPVGEVEGDTPDAIVARIENQLKLGDLVAAGAEWDKLPEAGKTASAGFKRSLDARIKVEALVDSALDKAVSTTKTNG